MKKEKITVDGVTYTLRPITVREADEAYDAAKKPDGELDGRLHMRLILVSSIDSPATTLEDVENWPLPRYLRLLEVCNRLNSVPEEGNAGRGETGSSPAV